MTQRLVELMTHYQGEETDALHAFLPPDYEELINIIIAFLSHMEPGEKQAFLEGDCVTQLNTLMELIRALFIFNASIRLNDGELFLITHIVIKKYEEWR